MTATITVTTTQQRTRAVAQTRANFALEGMLPDRGDLLMQERYIAGKATIADLLAHAKAFAMLAAKKHHGMLTN